MEKFKVLWDEMMLLVREGRIKKHPHSFWPKSLGRCYLLLGRFLGMVR